MLIFQMDDGRQRRAVGDSLPLARIDALRDPRHPASRIAGVLGAYLETIAARFRPEAVVLFGSYAYGNPTPDSDVDLLLIQDFQGSPVEAASAVRAALRPVRRRVGSLPCDILVESPASHRERLARGGSFYRTIWERGLRLM